VTLAEEGASLVLTTGRGRRYAVDLLPDGRYPRTPALPPTLGDAPGFTEALRYVIESAGRDEAVPVLTGIRLIAADGKLSMLATNRYELSRAVVPWDGLDFDVFVQARMVSDFMRTLGGSTLSVRADDRRFGLSAGGLSASFPIMEGGFDAAGFSKMIDEARDAAMGDDGGILISPREGLLDAIKDIEPVLDNNDPITFHLDPDEGVQLSARGAVSGTRAAVPLPGEYIGPAMNVKVKYLGALTRVPSPYVALGFLSPIKPVHVIGQREEDSEAPDFGVQHIVMPLRGN
jgi:DNA polymerase-3 subunit beta